MERTFTGWSQPILAAAASELWNRYRSDTVIDLHDATVVLPTRRAIRRLDELLSERATLEQCVVLPGRVITTGELPEVLYRLDAPKASDAQRMVAWWNALESAPRERVEALVHDARLLDVWSMRWDLVRMLDSVVTELAAGALEPTSALTRLERLPDFFESDRWCAIAELTENYRRHLRSAGVEDHYLARLDALAEPSATSRRGQIWLIGCVDLPEVTRRLLRQSAADVHAMIFAPGSHEAGFDELGCLVRDYWQEQPTPVTDAEISVAATAGAAAAGAIEDVCEALEAGTGGIVVGLADEAMVQFLEEAAIRREVPLRPAAGMKSGPSRVGSFLSAFARYLDGFRYADASAFI
ncbi:MAG: hypothetical protein KDD44_01865, partial [Bdellovibrionales bacterium]|nr:hypothetical protein [Bdellovibrionales bacterium]